MYKLSKRSLDTMVGVNPDLVKVIKEAIVNSPFDFLITQGLRTAKYQNELYQQGRTKRGLKVTNADGYIKKSNHQMKIDGFGYAIDFAVLDKATIDWDTESKYKAVAKHILDTGHKLGIALEWGGDWKFKDYPHIQLKGADKIAFKK